MAKKIKKPRSTVQSPERKTNWLLIGGIVGIGVIGLFGMLFASLQGGGAATPSAPTPSFVLEDYCAANPQNCIVEGAADAPITVVEISDYGCGHCRNFNLDSADTLKAQFVDSGQMRWIRLPYALGGASGYPTLPSASASFCAYEQGAFDNVDKSLFASQGTGSFNTRESFISIAEQAGLDVAAFTDCIDNGRYESQILENIQAANRSGVSATPTFFVNGQVVRGNLPLANFQQLINAELANS